MCGLAALFAYADTAPPLDRDALERMGDQMQRRGPDGRGTWISEDGRVGLTHRRLSILDLSPRAAQPLKSADGQLVISYNGEIYNYRALRASLERKGYVFRTDSDTEVLLRLYEDQGEAMLAQLRGMFAFALWDGRSRSLFLARDPFGIKPLYYALQGGTLWVASQIRALLAGMAQRPALEPAGLCGFFLLGSVPEPWTCCRGIQSLPAGHWLRLESGGQPVWKPYASLPQLWASAEQSQPEAPLAEILRPAVLDSVRHHLVAHVPVGLFLSAGIDSGALAGFLGEIAPGTHALTLAFSEFTGTTSDESLLAAQIAQTYGLRHHSRQVSKEAFQDDLPDFLADMDQPTVDGLNTWLVSKAAREAGWKVAISGLGSDEWFGGYPAFRDIPRWNRRWGWAARWPKLVSAFQYLYRQAARRYPLPPKGAAFLEYAPHLTGAWLLRRGLFLPWELPQWLEPDLVAEGLERLQLEEHLRETAGGPRSTYARIACLEAGLYMRNQLLRDTDWAGMAHSLEIRVPFVDMALLHTLAPGILAAQGTGLLGKQCLAQAPSPPLPTAVQQRPKSGFSIPIAHWLGGRTPKHWHWSRHWAIWVAKHWEEGLLQSAFSS